MILSHDVRSHTKNLFTTAKYVYNLRPIFTTTILIVVVDFKISKLEIRARETTLGMMFLEANAHIPCHIKNANYVYILLLNTC